MPRLRPRIGAPLLAVALVAVLAPAVRAVDLSPAAYAAAEHQVVDDMNHARDKRGLVKLREDSRLMAIARDRAEYMAANDIFSHVHSGGRMAWDLMTERGVKWYGAGEIIVRNDRGEPRVSAELAFESWMASAGHKAQILADDFNYVGVAVAASTKTGFRYWVGVFINGPDRTGAKVTMGKTTKTVVDRRHTRLTIRWSGKDVRLQVHTSGLDRFQVQRRVDGGAWHDYGTTKKTKMTKTWTRGHTYDVRVRARDARGNWGAWKSVRRTL